jgi:uncharacterized protein (TIGR01244 family)
MTCRLYTAPLLLLLAACASSEPAPAELKAEPPEPALSEALEWPGVNYAFQQGNAYFTGQPSEETLRHAAAQGVRTVINLRDDDQTDVPFDEAATAQKLGLTYRHVPISGKTFTAEDVATFGELLQGSEGPVMIHCRSSNRVGALWASHLVGEGRIEPAQAIEHGKAAGLRKQPTIERTQKISAELAPRR